MATGYKCTKVNHDSLADAYRERRRLWDSREFRGSRFYVLDVYRCDVCKKFHLGHRLRRNGEEFFLGRSITYQPNFEMRLPYFLKTETESNERY